MARVVREVVGDERRDEVVAVVVAVVAPQCERLAGGEARGLEPIGVQLLGEKLVGQALVDQQMRRARAPALMSSVASGAAQVLRSAPR